MSSVPYRRPKLVPHGVKITIIILGIVFVVAAIALLLSSVVKFFTACSACFESTCSSFASTCGNANAPSESATMEATFIYLFVFGIVSAIIGGVLIKIGTDIESRKSFLKKYKNAVFCPNCDEIFDVRKGKCPKCGTEVETNGIYFDKSNAEDAGIAAANSSNPYEAYMNTLNKGNQNLESQQNNSDGGIDNINESNNNDDNNSFS